MGGIYLIVLIMTISFTYLASFFIKTLLGIDNVKHYKKRMQQLDRVSNKKTKKSVKDVLEMASVPGDKIFSRWISPDRIAQIERKIRYAEWDNVLNGRQFLAIDYSAKVISVLLFLTDGERSLFTIMMYIAIFIAPTLLLNNQASLVQKQILHGFPEFADLVEGYLAGRLILGKSIEKSIPFLGKSWKKLMTSFIIDASEKQGFSYAINNLVDKVESSAVRDFFILLKLSIEQGIDSLQCFEEQATLVSNLLEEKTMNTIDNKEMLTLAIQFPLLICNVIVMGLYYLVQVLGLFSSL